MSVERKQAVGIPKWPENKYNGRTTKSSRAIQSELLPKMWRKKKSTLEQEKLRGNKGNTWLFCEP